MSEFDPNHVHKKIYVQLGVKAVVLNNEDRILLLQRSEKAGGGGKWGLLGGSIDQNEDPQNAIFREIDEEAGLKVLSEPRPFAVKSGKDKDGEMYVVIGYYTYADDRDITLNWEHTAFQWVTLDEVSTYDLTEDAEYFFAEYQVTNA